MIRNAPTRSSSRPLRRLVLAPLAVASLVATAAAMLSTDAAGAAVTVSGNLVKDPEFASGAGAWTSPAGTSLSIVAGHNGHKAIAETNTSGRALTGNVNDRVNTVASTVKGATYTASAWIRVSVSRISAAVREGEWKGSSSPGPAASGTAWLTTTAWTFVTVDYVALTTGATIDLNYLAWALPARASLYVSEPSLVAKVPGTPTQVTVTPADQTVGYGDSDPAFTYATTGLQGTDTLTAPPTCGVAGAHSAVGSYPITCSGASAGSNYTVVYGAGTLTVSPSRLTIAPSNQAIGYGSSDPAFTYTATGLQGSDSLTAPPTCGVAGAHSAVGSYPITCSGASAGSNYTVVYGTGTLTVASSRLTITPSNQTIGYGSSDPAFTYTATGLQGSDSLTTAPTCGVADAHSAVGTYPITCSGASTTGNYAVVYGTGLLTVAPAQLTVSPANQASSYGNGDPAFTYTVTGLQGSDSLTTAPTCGVAGAHSAVGTYPITCSGADAGGNYTVAYDTGSLTVAPARVVVTPLNQSSRYGDGDPAFTYTTAGLVPGESLTTPATCQVAPAHVSAGSYPITCSGAGAGGNYTVAYGTGTLTVAPARVTVTPADQRSTYGNIDPAFTYTTAGLLPGDSLSTQATCLVAGVHAAAGSYPITCSGADAGGNYTVAYGTGTLTVAPAQVAVVPANQSITSGSSDPAFTYATTGLRGSDALITAPTCGVTGSHSAVGTYPITCAGADAGGNYTVAYGTGTLTVSAATRTMVFDDEFNGTAVDTSKWRVRNNSWASNELSIVTSRPSNVFVSNGVLTLRAQREQYTVGSTTRSYTSGYLDTIGLSGYEYGRWEMRAKLPSAQGLWPAFWLRGDHTTGEIDILEAIGGLPQMAVQTVFPNTNDGSVKKSNVFNLPAGNGISNWHVYGFNWTPGSMSWDIDGVTVFTVTSTTASWVGTGFLDTFNIRLNLQVGGSMPNYFQKPVDASTPFPADYQVDYVRVYDR